MSSARTAARTTANRSTVKTRKAISPPRQVPIKKVTEVVPQPAEGTRNMDHSYENPDLTHAQMATIGGGVTMRVYQDPLYDNVLIVDFVHADGTRVQGETEWGFWHTPPYYAPPQRMSRAGERKGATTHVYYCPKQGKYEVLGADGSIIRTLSFPPQVLLV
ncbi:hypothetical protein PLICRDRAFT_38792 [Plicaturopsis crispa FD-325 SS-3]|nr:hypothetical protein PLICRDRAFT_38792 [Plicaturopsis crispa FD-325 SS-3]